MNIFARVFSKIFDIFKSEKDRFILIFISLFCLGSYLSIISYQKTNFFVIILSGSLLFLSFFLAFFNKKSALSYVFYSFFALFFGFVCASFNQKISDNYQHITGKIFVDVEGRIEKISHFHNSRNHQNGLSLTVRDLNFYQSKFTKNKKEKKKKRKLSESYIHKNFMNIKGFSEIDYLFLIEKANYQNIKWKKDKEKLVYEKPPKKIRVFALKNIDKLKLESGDKVKFKAVLTPFDKKDFLDSFDFGFYSKSQNISAQGYVISELKIIEKYGSDSIFNGFFDNLRDKVQKSIKENVNSQEGAVINALLTGDRKNIDDKIMQNIRNSGLAHLIAISGLHLTLSASIFFFIARFLLLQNSYLALNFNVKKIAAIFAIFGSFFYLKIAGSPISAERAFIMVCLAMIAILFDRKNDLLRIVFIAAFLIVLINPHNLFSIGFQLSFAAVLSIAVFHEIWSNFYDKYFKKNNEISKIHNFSKYLFEMVFISFVAQLANTMFLVYHFGNLAIYGILSNLIAIPLTSFLIMPLGFLSLFLMIFSLENLTLNLMSYLVSIIIKVSEFVSSLDFSVIEFEQITKLGLSYSIFGGLIFVIFKNKYLKIIGFLLFFSAFLTLGNNSKPNILIDGDARFIALYDEKNGLVFSEKLRKSKKRDLWLEKMDSEKFISFHDFSSEKLNKKGIICYKELCEIDLEKYFARKLKIKKILILKKRVMVKDICRENIDLVVNLTKKYEISSCYKKLKIDSRDLLKNGGYFIFFKKEGFVIKNVDNREILL